MKPIATLCIALLLLATACETPASKGSTQQAQMSTTEKPDWVLVIHGGAGAMKRANMSAEAEASYRAGLQSALDAGTKVLADGGTSAEAVETAIRLMEDNPLFNSGKGAVLTNEGTAELDASFMDGKNKNAGAVAGVKILKHPITAARLVMDSSVHVMMAGRGAEIFAKGHGVEIVENDYFKTDRRVEQLKRVQSREQSALPDPVLPWEDRKFGTVGCVALDQNGNLAAGTSTGGMMNKRWGRVGDSPIIGAGTYADNATCAVSCTGHGEYFIRNVIAYNISAQMAYGDKSLSESADHVIFETLADMGGTGGLIAVDHQGNVATPFNTDGMFRAFRKSTGEESVAIYKE